MVLTQSGTQPPKRMAPLGIIRAPAYIFPTTLSKITAIYFTEEYKGKPQLVIPDYLAPLRSFLKLYRKSQHYFTEGYEGNPTAISYREV